MANAVIVFLRKELADLTEEVQLLEACRAGLLRVVASIGAVAHAMERSAK